MSEDIRIRQVTVKFLRLGRIIKYGGDRPTLYFNYKSQYNDVWARPDLQEKHQYSAIYPEGDAVGTAVPLLAAAGGR